MFRRFRRSPQPQLQAETAAATPYNRNNNNKNEDIAAAAATVSELPNTPQKPHNNNDDEAAQPHMPSVRSTSGSDMASHSEADEEDDGHILHAVNHTCKPPLLRPQKSRSTSPAAAATATTTTTTTRVLPSSLPYSSDWSLITSPADLSPPIGIGPTRQQQQQQATTAGHRGSHQPQLFVTVGPPANAEAPNQMEEWATMTPTLSYCHVSSSSPPPNTERQQQEEGNEEDERLQGEVHARHDSETTVTTPPPATEVKRRFGMAAAASLLPRSPALSSPMTSLFVRLLPVSPSTETCTSAAHASRGAAPTTTSSSTLRPNKMNSGVAAPATIVRMPALSEGSVSTETAAQSLEESPFIAASSFAPSMASVLHASESCEPAPRVLSDAPSHESNWTSAGKTRMLRTRSVCGGAGVVSDCVLWLWQAVREDVLYHWYPQLLLVLGNREVRYAGQGRIRHRSKSAMTGRGADGVSRWERRAHKRRRCVSPDACGGNDSEEDIQMSWHWSLSSDTVATAVHSFLIFLL